MSKKVRLDENIPHGLRLSLTGCTAITTKYLGWAGAKNGALIALAEEDAFHVMITADRGLIYQQNMKRRKLALVVLSTGNKKAILSNAAGILKAINTAAAGSYMLLNIH